MERQGHFRGFQIVSGYSFVWVVLAVLLLSVDSWASCFSSSYGFEISGRDGCRFGNGCNPSTCSNTQQCRAVANGCPAVRHSGSYYWTKSSLDVPTECRVDSYPSGCLTTGGGYPRCWYTLCCTDQRSADSANCVAAGNNWSSEGSGGCLDDSMCDEDRQACEAAGGTFSGGVISSNGQTCCSAECNLCSKSAMERRMAQKTALCCRQGMAPPGKEKMCRTPVGHAGFKCGMAISEVSDEAYDWQCRDPGLDEENFQSYIENCEGGSSDSQGPGSSASSAGSSGEEGSSGQQSQYPEGCDECPWLDSILDTLTEIKSKVDNIEQCVTDPLLCNNIVNDETVDSVYIDSTILNGIKELMDSTIELSDEQVRLLMSIDSTVLKMLISDSITREAIATAVSGGASDIVAEIGIASSNVHGGLVQVKNGIMEMDTAMRSRLDSLLKTIPSDVLDSIVKYQDSVMDRFDSALFGKGVGFSLVDSMIDTVVKYFSVSNHYDSMYNFMFGNVDSTLKSIGDKMDNMSFGIEVGDLSFGIDGPIAMEGSGYGDTASTTLREDLNSMKGAITDVINHMDSSVGVEIRNLVNEQKEFYMSATGYGVSGSSTMKGDLQGINEGIGNIGGKLDSVFHVGTVDTGVVGFIVGDGNLTADSIANGYGYGRLNFARDTSDLNGALGAQFVEDSTSLCVGGECLDYESQSEIDAGFQRRLSSAADTLIQSNEEFYADSMDGMISRIVRTLDSINPFGVFDSTLVSTLGMKVPNTNTCPEHCSKFSVDIPFSFGVLPTDIDFGLCTPRVVVGNQNVLAFLRFLIRCIVAVMCIGLVVTNLPKSI